MKRYQFLIALLVLIFVVVGLAAVTQDQVDRASGTLLDVLKKIAVTLTQKTQSGEGLFQ